MSDFTTVVPTSAQPRRPRTTLLLLRLVVVLSSLMIFAQPVLAGAYLQGEFDALGQHSTNGSTLPAVLLLQIGTALGYWLIGRGSVLPFVQSIGLFFAVGMQIGMGYSRTLAVHIPLGVAIVAFGIGQLIWVFTRGASIPRTERGQRPARTARSGTGRDRTPT